MINSNTTSTTTPSLKRRSGTITLLLGLGVALGTLTGCPAEEQSPLEAAGETIEEAAEDTKSAIEDAFDDDGPLEKGGEALDDAGENFSERVEEAGENLSESAEEAKEDFKEATE